MTDKPRHQTREEYDRWAKAHTYHGNGIYSLRPRALLELAGIPEPEWKPSRRAYLRTRCKDAIIPSAATLAAFAGGTNDAEG